MINCSYLKYPPLKPKKLPKYLIFRNIGEEAGRENGTRVYNAINTKTGKVCGQVTCVPESIVRDKQRVLSMYVDELISYKPDNGVGTTLLNFIKALSKKYGCGGRFHLCASACYMPNRIPHVFYRKYGMTTGNKNIDNKLDKFIKKGKDATYKDFDGVIMYYPPITDLEKNKSKSIGQSFINFLSNMLTSLVEHSGRAYNG